MPHCCQTCRLHPLKPTRQTVSGWAASAQPPCPAHGQRRKDCSLALAGSNPRGGDCRFHSIALLPKARESVKATESSFRSGGGTFLDLIDAQRVMLEFELAYERSLAERMQRLAELEKLVGREIPAPGEPRPPRAEDD